MTATKSNIASQSAVTTGKRKRKALLTSTALAAAGLMALTAQAQADNWTDHEILTGSTAVDTSVANTTNILQSTDFVKARGSGDIHNGWTVNVAQPSASAKYVLYDVKGDATQLLGTLNANGEIYIFNQQGVIFGADSVVNVGAIVASTGSISDEDIMNGDGKLVFQNVDTGASITLNGSVTVAEAGLAAFVAPSVINNGVISAKLGEVALASGNKVTLDLYGDNLVEIAVDDKVANGLIENKGVIDAEAGTVYMAAQTAKEAVDTVINMRGVVSASSASVQGGKIVLSGGKKGKVVVEGAIKADGAIGGGSIDVRGQDIEVAESAFISADATQNGDGGAAVVFADNVAIINGRMSARGGALSGNGGFIETSGLELGVSGTANVDVSAANGLGGLWLLDPLSIVISDSMGSTVNVGGSDYKNIYTGTIEATLLGGNVTVQTGAPGAFGSSFSLLDGGFFTPDNNAGDIRLRDGIDYIGGAARTLSLIAHRDILLENNADINNYGGGNLSVDLQAQRDIIVNSGSVVDTNGGNVNFTAGDDIELHENIYTNGGSASFTADDRFEMDNVAINTSNGNVNVVADEFILDTGSGQRINAGSGTISIARESNGSIGLGGASGDMEISQFELNKMTAAALVIGRQGTMGHDTSIRVEDANLTAFNTVTLNTRRNDSSGNEYIRFYGDNTSKALVVNADDNIELRDDATLDAHGDVTFNANTNGLSDGDFVMRENSRLTMNGYDLHTNALRTILEDDSVIDGEGGDINLYNTRTFFSDDLNSVRTAGTGTITLQQNNGGSIQNAVNALANSGAGRNTVNVGPGTYNESVTVSDANVSVLGTGATVNPNSPGFHVTGDNAVISGFVINSASGLDGYGVWVDGADNATISNNTINNSAQSGIQFTNAVVGLATGNVINNSAGTGIGGQNVGNMQVVGNVVNNAGDDGIGIGNSAGTIIRSNVINSAFDDGINLTNSLNAVIGGASSASANVISGTDAGFHHDGINVESSVNTDIAWNVVNNSSWDGINVYASTGTDILNNTVNTSYRSGVTVGGSTSTLIQNNTLNGNWGGFWLAGNAGMNVVGNLVNGATGWHGAYVDGGSNITLNDNVIYNTAGDGVEANNVSGLVVVNNKIGMNAALVSQGAGNIAGEGVDVNNSPSAVIAGNWITGFVTNGVSVNPSPGSVISANIITGGANGIVVDNSDNVTVASNQLNGQSAYGVWVHNGSDASVVAGNTVTSGAGSMGVRMSGGDNHQVLGNIVNGGLYGIVLTWTGSNNTVAGNIVGQTTGTSSNSIYVYQNTGTTNVLGNRVYNAGWDGIQIFNGIGFVTLSANEIRNTTGASGIAILDHNGDALVDNNLVDGADRLGIYVQRSDGLTVSNNRVNDTGREAGWWTSGIHLEGADNTVVSGNRVTNTNNGGDGIHVGGAGNFAAVTTSGNVISGNVVYRTAGDGISVDDSNGVAVIGNKIGTNAANVTQGNNNIGRNGIVANNSNNALIAGNRVRETVLNGIFVDPSDDVEIANNNVAFSGTNGIYLLDGNRGYIHNNTVDESGQDGIKVDNNSDVRVHDNNVDDSGDSGIEVWNSFNADIVGNDVSDSDGDGIELGNSNWADVRNNNVEDSGDDGIDVDNSDDVDVNNNNVDNSDFNGIEVTNSNDAEVGGNTVTRAGVDGINMENGDDGWIHNNVIRGTAGGFFASGVAGAGRDGIHVDDNDGVLIEDNLIQGGNGGLFSSGGVGAGRNGIHVVNSFSADVLDNTVTGGSGWIFGPAGAGAGQDGIFASNNAFSDIRWNDVSDTGDDGIDIRNSVGVDVVGNATDDTGGDGIQLRNSAFADVLFNDVDDAGDDGIDVENSAFVDVNSNEVHDTDENGIEVTDSFDADIRNNHVGRTGGDGVFASNIAFGDIRNNYIHNTWDDGIDVRNSFGVDVVNNETSGTFGDGIQVWGNLFADVINNRVRFAGDDGIDIENNFGSEISGNDVDFVARNGIEISDSAFITVDANDIGTGFAGFVGGNGIDVRNVFGIDITNNMIGTFVQDNGIYVNPSNQVLIQGNNIDGVGQNGILLNGNDQVRVISNVISNSGARGLFASGPDNVYIFLEDNTFTNNPIGAEFESGEIDLTGLANTFNGGDIALRFAPAPGKFGFAPMSLTGNTIGETIFNGQTTYYVELANGAFFAPGAPTLLDGLNATYDGFRPSTVGGVLTQAQYDAIEAKIYHFNDLASLGLFFFGFVPAEIDQEDIFRNIAGFNPRNGGLNLTITGLPTIPGFAGSAASFLNSIAPAAGGNAQGGQKPQRFSSLVEQLANIAPAAGGDAAGAAPAAEGAPVVGRSTCWGDAMAAAGAGGIVNMSYDLSPDTALSDAAACQSGI
ncbi:MAG: right-handed parallel beta-helix repeat-containing protein [Micavibrio aeruginosavorus]|uniref:Right-handed parallel beta-helix repeat-containing protein n=1 Tax=Micavibrio aeruginosavorus TaxID=349221 RepID=A0A7T5UHG7_9BACT|nr:MAG: right-handed parallel beta-helix repeat-containing protein [Micavibrio aeruginosavorus]